jgi:hypothetical protein
MENLRWYVSLSIALPKTFDSLRSNPILFVPIALIMILQVPQVSLRPSHSGLANLFVLIGSPVFVFGLPFLHGSFIGMADEALDADTSLATFFSAGKHNYVSLLIVFLAVLAISLLVGVVMSLVGIFAIFTNYPGGAGETGALTALLLVILGFVGLAYFIFLTMIQFYAQAIVIDDQGARASIEHSIALVRSNLGNVIAYSVAVGVLVGIAGGLFRFSIIVTSWSAGPLGHFAPPLTGSSGVLIAVIINGILFGGFYSMLSVAFYRTLSVS